MADFLKKVLEPIKELQNIRGVELPIGLEFLQLVVTGPPGAGKSYYIEQIGGWPNEGYLDLTQKGWWRDQSLIYRPREVHLGLPFMGHKESLTVFDKEWLTSPVPPEIDYSRIKIPPIKQSFFQTNWHNRYIFEFLIPSPSTIFQQRTDRQSKGYFPVDKNLTLEMVKQQVAIYREIALYLHRAGINVYIRKGLNSPPMLISEKGVASVPRWALNKKPRRASLKTLAGWIGLFHRPYPIQWLSLTDTPKPLTKPARIAHDGRCFELHIGDMRLRFQPEIAMGVKKKAAHKNWIINSDQGCSAKSIQGFVRLCLGETIVIGSANDECDKIFHFTDSVAKRHISVTNRKGDILLTPLAPEHSTKIVRPDNLDHREQLERGRLRALFDIRSIYGQDIEPLPPKQALQTIQQVNELLLEEPSRPKNNQGMAGGLIEIPNETTPVIVGDLHAQVDNLLKILSENCLLDCLKLQTASLIILGDAIHSENNGEMDSFETSMLIMDLIFKLKLKFPENVFYIRGNHDTFDPEINKNGFLQGDLFRQKLLEDRGEDYVTEMQIFYDRLPYLVYSSNFIACHAGPPRKKVSRKELLNIADNDKLAGELTQNRLERPNYPGGYSKRDIRKLKKSLGLSTKVDFIVGHTPLDPFGSFWLNAGSIKNHHIIYSAQIDGPSIFIQNGSSFMPISFPAEPLTSLINDLAPQKRG